MDESAQQAVQLGVNITIFVIALTISVSLLLGVRDVADVAAEYNASIPTGSRVVTVSNNDKRTVAGNELLSYYANYMTDINNERTDKYKLTIINGSNRIEEEERPEEGEVLDPLEIENLEDFLIHKLGIGALSKEYEVITEKYGEENEYLEVILKAID